MKKNEISQIHLISRFLSPISMIVFSKLRAWSIIIITLFIVMEVKAQPITLPFTLKWKEVRPSSTQMGEMCPTENGFFDPVHRLPLRNFHIPAPLGMRAKVQIIPEKWEPYSLSFTNTPPSELQFNENILKISGKPFLSINITPICLINDIPMRLIEGKIIIEWQRDPVKTAYKTWKDKSVLSEGPWFKFPIKENGIYKLTGAMMKSAGIPIQNISSNSIKIYGNGGAMIPEKNDNPRIDDLAENPIAIYDGGDGVMHDEDYILFWGEGTTQIKYSVSPPFLIHETHHYDDQNYYFLTWNTQPGLRIQTVSPVANPNINVRSFDEILIHEEDKRNASKSGRTWYSDDFDKVTEAIYSHQISHPVQGEKATFISRVLAQTYGPAYSTFEVWYKSNLLLRQSVEPRKTGSEGNFANVNHDTAQMDIQHGEIQFLYTFSKNASGAIGWLDYFTLNYRRELNMSGSNQLYFRDSRSVGTGNKVNFQLSNCPQDVEVWDVTDPMQIQKMSLFFNASEISFSADASLIRNYIAFVPGAYKTPGKLAPISNQNLHALEPVSYIIINADIFSEASHRLANFRKTQGETVHVISLPQIYHEFSSGKQDVSAIRDFIKMMYDRGLIAGKPLRNVLLMGAASYDYKDRLKNNTNYVPTYQSREAFTIYSYGSDDYYGLLDDGEGSWNGFEGMDIGIGRLPVKTLEQAQGVVNKIIHYNQPSAMGDWKNNVLVIADDRDWNVHLKSAEDIGGLFEAESKTLNVYKIYLDAYKKQLFNGVSAYPDANTDLKNLLNKGMLIVNYSGHGGTLQWADERIFDVEEINQMKNMDKLPFFMAATCDFGPYDDPSYESAGQRLVLNAQGGAIGILTSTRIANTGQNSFLNESFLRDNLFKKGTNGYPSLGEAYQVSKSVLPSWLRNFSLLADPAQYLHLPYFEVSTTHINSIPVSPNGDTLKAFQKITIQGEIRDTFGNISPDFQGVVYPVVYDKPTQYQTLANDPSSISTPFSMQNSVLFRGRASVEQGKFSFSFIVPRDIQYNPGNGKISYYAVGDRKTAWGSYNKFVIGGTSETSTADVNCPQISLFIQDSSFVNGGLSSANPMIYARLYDESGINTSNSGIGHQMTLVVDGIKEYYVNDFFQSDVNDFTKGTLWFPLEGLNPGWHEITLKAWDVFNNGCESTLKLNVADGDKFAITELSNFPNPFSQHTTFRFAHNRSGENLEADLRIYNLQGQLVKNIKQTLTGADSRPTELTWDARDHFGARVTRGLYVYQLMLTDEKGESVMQSQKLIIL